MHLVVWSLLVKGSTWAVVASRAARTSISIGNTVSAPYASMKGTTPILSLTIWPQFFRKTHASLFDFLRSIVTVDGHPYSALSNSSFVLAAKHTHWRDPLDNFKHYDGVWNIRNNQYWLYVFLLSLSLIYLCFCFFFVTFAIYQIYLCKFLLNVSYVVCWIYCSSSLCSLCVVVCGLWIDLNLYLLLCLLLQPPKLLLFLNSLCTIRHSTCDLHACFTVSKLSP